jgi:D-alanine-D-alanine ligase
MREGRLSVAVVQGGPSTEAEVSRASAKGVAQALTEAKHQAVRLELDAFLAESLRSGGFDVVFPVAHGAVGEDGSLQGLLEVLDLPYVGSGVLASAMAMDKGVARVFFERVGLPVAKGIAVRRSEGDARAAARRARAEVGARVVVKPASHGSAIGVARLEAEATEAEVARAFEAVWEIDEAAIVEHFVRGRELTCGVMELMGEARALPPTEILPTQASFYTYEAKYAPGGSRHVCPADLPAAVLAKVQKVAVAAHVALGCRDLSRVDLIVGDEGKPDELTLLEVNTVPGMTATSLFPEAAAVAGWPMAKWCDAMVRKAHARGGSKRFAAKPLPA